ncbi:secreted RxLR effector protein 161-like [Rutidosis leptorrhynchoides]|uniref:secreted RxLR effector protein 161-like n=1 Tax=Rutidosis leptorrhynchoides TaxID=125765 RepID=UPI003A98DF78
MMEPEFKMTDLGFMKNFLGLEIEQKEDEIFVHQKKYALDMLKKFQMENFNEISIPMEVQLKLQPTKPGEEFDSTVFRSMIGSLMYLCASRPDLACTVNMLASCSSNPSKEHAAYVRRILRFLKSSCDYGLWYEKGGKGELLMFCDASCGNEEKYRSKSGYCSSFGSRIFSWSSKCQKIVAQSTVEAEYIAINLAAK